MRGKTILITGMNHAPETPSSKITEAVERERHIESAS
jgi:hypothetical protein